METVRPEAAGFSSKKLDRLIPLMNDYVSSGKVPGLIIMIARRGKVVFAEACGANDISKSQPMPVDGIFQLASQTKVITAAAGMILYEEGKFQLKDPVAKYLPEFAGTKVFAGVVDGQVQTEEMKRPMTIEDLFTHQAGIVLDGFSYPVAEELLALYNQARLFQGSGFSPEYDLASLTAKIASLPLYHQPGQYWRYGDGFEVLARLIEVIAEMPFAEFLNQRIFEPLGMADTGYFVPPEKADRLARCYRTGQAGAFEDKGEEEFGRRLIPPKVTPGGGGLLSTANDFTRFAQMMANGGQLDGVRILSRKTIEFMAANRLRPDQLPFWPFPDTLMAGYGFGLGVRVLMDPAQLGIPASAGEFGWSGWFNTGVWIDPAEQLSGVLMAQVGPPEAFWPHIPPLEVRRIVYQAIED